MRWMIVVAALFALTACASTPEERAAQLDARYGGDCQALGIQKGTPEYGNCLLQMHTRSLAAFGALGSMRR